MLKQKKFTLLLGLLLASPLSAYAEAEEDRGGTKWGPFRAIPRIDLQYTATDNYFREASQEKATGLLTINPGLTLEAGTATMKYILDADLVVGKVTRSHDDDYNDLTLGGQAIYQPTSRVKLDLSAQYKKGHEDRGTSRTEGNPNLVLRPDKFDRTILGAQFTYGIAEAKGQLVLNMDYLDIDYTNNRVGTRPRDRDGLAIAGLFKWRVGSKTSVLFEARNQSFNYDFNTPGTFKLDSDEQRYFVGVEWQATYKTTGSFRIGRMRKDFDSVGRKDLSEGAWEAGLDWAPRSYSVVSVSTGRTFGESNGTGNVILTDYFNVAWNHGWTDRLSSKLAYNYSDDEFPGTAAPARQDDSNTYIASVDYKAKRWLTVGAGFEHTKKDSNINTFDYDQNSLFVNARMKF